MAPPGTRGLPLRLVLRCPDILAHKRRRVAPLQGTAARPDAAAGVLSPPASSGGLIDSCGEVQPAAEAPMPSQLQAWGFRELVPLTQLDDSAEGRGPSLGPARPVLLLSGPTPGVPVREVAAELTKLQRSAASAAAELLAASQPEQRQAAICPTAFIAGLGTWLEALHLAAGCLDPAELHTACRSAKSAARGAEHTRSAAAITASTAAAAAGSSSATGVKQPEAQVAEELLASGYDLLAYSVSAGATATAQLIMGSLVSHRLRISRLLNGPGVAAAERIGIDPWVVAAPVVPTDATGPGHGNGASGALSPAELLERCRCANGSGHTLLHLAVQSRSIDTLRLVAVNWPRDLGVSISLLNRPDHSGRSPADYLPLVSRGGAMATAAGGTGFEAEAEALLQSLGLPAAGEAGMKAALLQPKPATAAAPAATAALLALLRPPSAEEVERRLRLTVRRPLWAVLLLLLGALQALAALLLPHLPPAEASRRAPPGALPLWLPAACLLSTGVLGAFTVLLVPLRMLAARPCVPATITSVGRCTALVAALVGRPGAGGFFGPDSSMRLLLMSLAPSALEALPTACRTAILLIEQAAVLSFLLLSAGPGTAIAWLPSAAANVASGAALAALLDLRDRLQYAAMCLAAGSPVRGHPARVGRRAGRPPRFG
ncbi:hypothetical protein GPECTOR_21g619 [Gonium pectorale]|uniref:Uncharacterized protein n=1 Tax=Gonium pectorale TaxID=33097 RepID=A0A150GHX0_GONPE|nr:hypothetical protein GPECTOR_21g619 [Gonium pectorale]|eukprot:KXZ49393.1 hypothetical protein GPECTOR_21g619 [Gonium pectorale]